MIGEDLTNAALTMRHGEISLVVAYEILDALGECVEFRNFKPDFQKNVFEEFQNFWSY